MTGAVDTEALIREALQEQFKEGWEKEKKEEEPKIELKAKVKEAQEGQKMFSKVFGYKPKVGEDFPVTLFDVKDLHPQIAALIPELDPAYQPQEEQVEQCVRAIEDEDKIMINGPTGSGKSSMVKYICAKTGRPLIRINMNGDVESSAIFGQIVVEDGATVWKDGAATEAMKYGAILLVDEWEVMPPEIAMGFQNPLEKGGYLFLKEKPGTAADKIVRMHKDCRLIFCGNTVGQGDDTGHFAGVNVQNTATLDRFDTVIYLGYLNEEHETNVLKNVVPDLEPKIIRKMLQFADLVRTAHGQGNITLTMSPRTLMNWGRKIVEYGNIKTALQYSFLNKLRDSDKKVVGEFHVKCFGR